jgi:hypothetical protein
MFSYVEYPRRIGLMLSYVWTYNASTSKVYYKWTSFLLNASSLEGLKIKVGLGAGPRLVLEYGYTILLLAFSALRKYFGDSRLLEPWHSKLKFQHRSSGRNSL